MSATTTLVGNITRDLELRITNGGTPMLSFSIAVNKNKKNTATGEWEKETSYFDIVAFNENAENAAQSFAKGTHIVVVGRLQQRKYTDKDGNERSKVEVIADEIAATVRWATVQVSRTERVEAGNRATPVAPAPNGNRREDYYGEEPF
jgi:single-strand DNA-binding protein